MVHLQLTLRTGLFNREFGLETAATFAMLLFVLTATGIALTFSIATAATPPRAWTVPINQQVLSGIHEQGVAYG